MLVSNSVQKIMHPIQVVARRTGLSADVIRAWERRYNAVLPQRSPTDRRLYSDEDVERLALLHRATQAGRRIGDIAHLSVKELTELVQKDKQMTQTPEELSIKYPEFDSSVHREACLKAVQALDPLALDSALNEAALGLSTPVLLDEVAGALMKTIGDQWRAGTLRACHEHMTTAQLRFFLGNLLNTSNMTGAGPQLLVTTPTGQRHELGALMVAVTAALGGWNPLYLGADISGSEIAFAVVEKNIKVVALSLSYPADDPRLPDTLRRLRKQLPEDVVLLIGGAAVSGYREVLKEIAALQPGDLKALSKELDRIRGTSG